MQRGEVFHKRIIILTAAMLIAFAVVVAFTTSQMEEMSVKSHSLPIEEYSGQPNLQTVKTGGADISFSLDKYFYTETVMLELDALSDDIVSVSYTLDSTPPNGENGILYEGSIELACPEKGNMNSYTVKACGQRADGSFTEIYTHSYFMGKEVNERFDTLVFSLSTDPYNLYDYDYGIFTPGRLRDEYIKETGDEDPDEGSPANYYLRGIESERPVYVEVFDRNGDLLISQNAGMRISGGYTRRYTQKSIKLFARSEYDPVNNFFDYDFFPDDATNYGTSITKYKRLVLRNSGNDRGAAYLRDETVQACAEETDLQDVQHSRAAAVFLNGEYYGFVWIKQIYSDYYFDGQNGIKDGAWAVLTAGEDTISIGEEDEFQTNAMNDHNEMYAYSERDLTDDNVFGELCELIDIDNFLTYYATQIYINNVDWPGGNKKLYRYYGSDQVDGISTVDDGNSTADGKWRWLLYDTDCALGLGDFDASIKTLGVLLGAEGEEEYVLSLTPSPLLTAILKRDDMKERFIGIMCDLMNYQFSPTNIVKTVREKETERHGELEHQFINNGADIIDKWKDVNQEIGNILTFAQNRPGEMKKQMEKYLAVDPGGYTVICAQHEDAGIKINSCRLNRNFEGFYYDMNTVTFTMTPPVGYRFSYWLVNGDPIYEQVMELTKDHAENGKINVELVIERSDENIPIISLVDYEEGMDYLVICNPYESNIDLRRFYISDDPQKQYKQILADCILRPGESLKLYCKNYMALDALGGFLLSFNLTNEETIYISDNKGNILQEVYLPKIKNDYLLIRDMKSGEFYDVARNQVD